MPFCTHTCPRHAVCCMPSMHMIMPDMPDMRAQVLVRTFAARRSHPRRPGAGQRIRYRSHPCTTPPMHTASHLPHPRPACNSCRICTTSHALPAQLHCPHARFSCAVFSHCVPLQSLRQFSARQGGQLRRAQRREHRCAHIF